MPDTWLRLPSPKVKCGSPPHQQDTKQKAALYFKDLLTDKHPAHVQVSPAFFDSPGGHEATFALSRPIPQSKRAKATLCFCRCSKDAFKVELLLTVQVLGSQQEHCKLCNEAAAAVTAS